MDFLDPRKRRWHNIRLMVGYGLTAIAIGLTSVILVYGAYGWGINTKTGDIVQNGLLFVDSKPGGAEIYLNGQKNSSTTTARLTLPAGNYELTIKKAGYRDWSRKFTLDEHRISRYVYPFLFPITPLSQSLKIYSSTPPLVSQSPDKRWLFIQTPTNTAGISFDVYDTTKLNQPPQQLSLPLTYVSGSLAGSNWKVVEWASDNNHLLLQHNFSGGSEFIVFSRIDPTTSFNVNQAFNTAPDQVRLRDKKVDRFYLYQQTGGLLQTGNVAQATLEPLLSNVLAFQPHGPDLLIYVTDQKVAAGQVMARIWENGKNYPLYTFSAGNKYLIDMAQFQGHWYYVAGSDTADRINIYKDPLSGIKDPATAKAIPLIAIPDSGAHKLAFSDNARFISVQAGQKFGVYDIETEERYNYSVTVPLSGEMHWMDGHHLIGLAGGVITILDADSFNQQTLTPASSGEAVFFDKNYNHMLTLVTDGSNTLLQRVDLRAGTDLPKANQ